MGRRQHRIGADLVGGVDALGVVAAGQGHPGEAEPRETKKERFGMVARIRSGLPYDRCWRDARRTSVTMRTRTVRAERMIPSGTTAV